MSDREVFAFQDAQTRLEMARSAEVAARRAAIDADNAFQDAWDNLTPDERVRVSEVPS